mgnify:CR=1 FL=1
MIRNIWDRIFWKSGINVKGDQVSLKRGIIFQKQNLVIENYVHLGPNYYIHAGGGVHIGKGTIIGPKLNIWTVNHDYSSIEMLPYNKNVINGAVEIGEGCWIGLNVSICPNVKIGNGVIIAMGAVVTKDIPDFAIIGGNPAKILKYRYETEDQYLVLQNSISQEKFYGKAYF